jgi:ABC-type glycerol-3-phosphate transport system permease component
MRLSIGVVVRQTIMVCMTIVCLFPILFVIITSLKTKEDYLMNPTGLPGSVTLQNYLDVLITVPFAHWFGNTILLAICAVTVATLISAVGSYAIAHGDFFGRETLLKVNIALMVVPPVVLIIPMFTVMVNVGLINSLWSAMVFYSGLLIPFSVYLLTSYYQEMPNSLLDAAAIDGCTRLGTLWRIVIPLSMPAVITLVVVNFLWVWNELLIALVFLQDESSRTVISGLSMFQGRFTTNEPLVMAGAFLSLLPTVLLYLFGQRYFIKGLTAGFGK